MILVSGLWTFCRAVLVGSAAIALENLALRHQLLVLQRSVVRPRLSRWDRVFFSEAACQEESLLVISRPLSRPRLCGRRTRCVVLAVRGLSSFSSRCQWRVTTRPRMMGDAIGRRRHLGHGCQRQPRRGSRSPPIHLVSQPEPPISLPPSCSLCGPSGRQRSPYFGRVIDAPIPPDRKQDPRQAPRQGHRGDGSAAPSGNPIRPGPQRGRLGSRAPAQNAPRGLDQEPAHAAIALSWSRTSSCLPRLNLPHHLQR
jgi:hypothetical protein